MSGTTITQSTRPTTVPTGGGERSPSWAQSRAARELGLKRGEFELAVHLGCVRTVPDDRGGGARRVARAEIDRVRSQDGSAEALRERVRAVGTTEGAALMGVTTARFTRLARLGLVAPVKFYLNRYRAVVWLYLAEELRQFAAAEENAAMLSGRIPEVLRDQLGTGLDLRARNWRGRHMGFLLRQTEDPWAQAAIVASMLDPLHRAELVRDPYERAYLNRLRPRSGSPHPGRLTSCRCRREDHDSAGCRRNQLAQGRVGAGARHGPATPPRPWVHPAPCADRLTVGWLPARRGRP